MGLPQTQLEDGSSETTPLLGAISRRPESPDTITDIDDLESQKPNIAPWGPSTMILNGGIRGTLHSIKGLANPKTWDRKVVWQRAVVDPVRCLPAVVVGLLLNILDALSYGMSFL